jgi:flagellar basal body-associated protein FliL
MAELHVQRKKGGNIWLWVFLIILLIAGGVYYYMHYHNPETYPLPTKSPAK